MTEYNEVSLQQVLDILTENGDGVVTISDGKVIDIKKCKVSASGVVIEFLHSALEDVVRLQDIIEKAKKAKSTEDNTEVANLSGGFIKDNRETIDTFMQMIAKYSGSLGLVVEKLSSISRYEFDDLAIDDAILVLYGIWEVNKSFFSGRVLTLVSALKNRTMIQK